MLFIAGISCNTVMSVIAGIFCNSVLVFLQCCNVIVFFCNAVTLSIAGILCNAAMFFINVISRDALMQCSSTILM